MAAFTLNVFWILQSCLIIAHSSIPLSQPSIIEITDGSTLTLNIEYCDYKAYNSDNQIIISLNTRCFCIDTEVNENKMNNYTITNAKNSTNKALHCSIPGPTLIVKNGISFNIDFVNNLDGSAYDTQASYPYELRNWPDVVNLHTHGLHVSPEWDNVFLPVNPRKHKRLHYEIPNDHYPGSHWYHSHFHQATELQIQGGLFGAMLVETDEDENDFYDDLILQFHFLFFYTTNQCECIEDIGELQNRYCYTIGFWDLCSLCFNWCANPRLRRMESGFEYFAESSYADENGKVDLPLINGQFQPMITLESGKWYRLRLINSNGQYYTQVKWPTDHCKVYIIAADGIYFQDGPRDIDDYPFESENIFDPGSRNDVAIKCGLLGRIGTHSVVYSQSSTAFSVLPRFPDQMTAFFINVIAPTNEYKMSNQMVPNYVIPPLPDYLYDSYRNSENPKYAVTRLCPCWTYEGGEYDLSCHWNLGRFGTSINGQMWNGPNEPILYVCKGKIYEFSVNSLHPLHLHTSPFQIMQNLPSDGQRIGFLAMAGDFRDTTSTDFGDFYIRYQATDFVGPIVTHCHFLPHEDEGMIVWFQIVDCDKNKPYKMAMNGTLSPFDYNPLKNVNIPDECDIFSK